MYNKTFYATVIVGLAITCLVLSFGCRSIPCQSIEALTESFDVFAEEYFDYVDADRSLFEAEKEIIRRHALVHKDLIEELGKLCEGD